MSDWSLRLARADDGEAFHTVEIDAATLLRDDPALVGVPVPPANDADHYRALIRKGRCLTAIAKSQVIGFAAAGPVGRELHLQELSVARVFQRRGVGTTLLKALAVDGRNSGFRAITLNTYRDVPWNGPFYARHGFVELHDLTSRPHLVQSWEKAEAIGLPMERRCAMIRFLG